VTSPRVVCLLRLAGMPVTWQRACVTLVIGRCRAASRRDKSH